MKNRLTVRKIGKRDKAETDRIQDNIEAPILYVFLDYEDDRSLEDLMDIRDCEGAVGVFDGDTLLAVATIGGGEEESDQFQHLIPEGDYPKVLSNLYVPSTHRNKGLAKHLVKTILDNTSHTVFLYFLSDDIIPFYESIGFSLVGPASKYNLMFTDRRHMSSLKTNSRYSLNL